MEEQKRKKKSGFFLTRQVGKFFSGRPEDCWAFKTVFAFPVGLGISCIFYLILINPLRAPESFRLTLGGIMGLGLAVGFAVSAQMRCMVFLLFPMFFSKEGRAYVSTFALALLISGPIANIMTNAREVTRALACSVELLENHTRAKTELQLKPLQNLANQLQQDGFLLEETMSEIDWAFQPIRKELSDESEVSSLRTRTEQVDADDGYKQARSAEIDNRYSGYNTDPDPIKKEKTYKRKLDYRCEDVFSQGVLRCKQEFRNAEKRCLDTIPVIGYILCLPLKLTILCELIRAVPSIIGVDCRSMQVVDKGLGEVYDASDKTMKEFDSYFDVEMKYKVEHEKEAIDVVTAKEVSKGIEREFSTRQQTVEHALNVVQLALGFAFVVLFHQAYSYTRRYITDIRFDNVYITSYFNKIDERRKNHGKSSLLPLRRFEMKAAAETTTIGFRSGEKAKLLKGTIRLLINVFIVSVVVIVDKLLYGVLDIIQRNSHIEYRQRGIHEVQIDVSGNGFMAAIVRSVLAGFNTVHTIDNWSTNFECLPKPIPLSSLTLCSMYAIYFSMWILLLFESYGLRLRRSICSFFFRKREKSRVLFLYNDLLKRRKGYLIHARRQVRKKARKQKLIKEISILSQLLQRWPRLYGYLRIFDTVKHKCLICEDPMVEGFHHCETENCGFYYCRYCWEDIEGRCYACAPLEDLASETDDSEDDTSDSD